MLKQTISRLESEINIMQSKLNKLEENFETTIMEAFSDFLTPNQIDILTKKKTKARWTNDEISRAFTLRYFSVRVYIYVRDTLKYPLPGISTLQRWASNISLRGGLLTDVIKIMELSGIDKTDRDRVTVLSFDETKVSYEYEYDQKEDEVIGPHNYMQVVMARGLFNNWNQPVYVGFDQKMTKTLLETIITTLHNVNYIVVACVSDCGGGNLGLWKELGITMEKTHCLHPVTGENIYFFADAPHLLKLIQLIRRHWFSF